MWHRASPEEVVRENASRVYQHLRRIFGHHSDVDDVFQAVFVEVLRSLPSFRGRSRLSTWIRRITWNVAYQEMRLQYRERSSVPLDDHLSRVAVTREAAEAALEQQEALARLYARLATLEPKERMVVIMHDIEQHTLKEIGETLGRPLPTVASQLRAARARLAAAITAKVGVGQARKGSHKP